MRERFYEIPLILVCLKMFCNEYHAIATLQRREAARALCFAELIKILEAQSGRKGSLKGCNALVTPVKSGNRLPSGEPSTNYHIKKQTRMLTSLLFWSATVRVEAGGVG